MQTFELENQPEFTFLVKAENRPIEKVYCADLLSWAMSRGPENCAWCTVMGNVNAVAVASLADMALVVLCENAQLDEDAKAKAQQQGINVVATQLPVFEAGVTIAKLAGLA